MMSDYPVPQGMPIYFSPTGGPKGTGYFPTQFNSRKQEVLPVAIPENQYRGAASFMVVCCLDKSGCADDCIPEVLAERKFVWSKYAEMSWDFATPPAASASEELDRRRCWRVVDIKQDTHSIYAGPGCVAADGTLVDFPASVQFGKLAFGSTRNLSVQVGCVCWNPKGEMAGAYHVRWPLSEKWEATDRAYYGIEAAAEYPAVYQLLNPCSPCHPGAADPCESCDVCQTLQAGAGCETPCTTCDTCQYCEKCEANQVEVCAIECECGDAPGTDEEVCPVGDACDCRWENGGWPPCEACDGCDGCDACQGCDACDGCDLCEPCQVCESCDGCDAGDGCPGCQDCEACQICQSCQPCQVCDGCDLCQACEACQVCQNCDGCDIAEPCCDSCDVGDACETCQSCEPCQGCEACDACQACQICQYCEPCQGCDTGDVCCDACDACQGCDACDAACEPCQGCDTCDLCDVCEGCEEGDCGACDTCDGEENCPCSGTPFEEAEWVNEGETELVKWDTGNPFVLVVNHPAGTPDAEVTKTVCFWTEGGWIDLSVVGYWEEYPVELTNYGGIYVNGSIACGVASRQPGDYGAKNAAVNLAKGCHEIQLKGFFYYDRSWVGTVTFTVTPHWAME